MIIILLSGCQDTSTEPINEDTKGIFNHYFVYSFSYLIKFLAGLFNGNYGLSIILITLIVRLVLMPMMIKQYRNQLRMKEIMAQMQPELIKIKEKYTDQNDRETQVKIQQETMELYKKYNFNPFSIGCLPMLIQFPILIGFYYAIRRTPEIAQHSFLWFNLGQPDAILPIIAGIVYFIQFKVSQVGIDQKQQKQFMLLGYLSPIMMTIFSYTTPAALPMYWITGGLFLIFQTLVTKKIQNKDKTLPLKQL